MSQTNIESNATKSEFRIKADANAEARAKLTSKLKSRSILFVVTLVVAMFIRVPFLIQLALDFFVIYVFFSILFTLLKLHKLGGEMLRMHIKQSGVMKLFE